jgi:hypothetical protein
VKNSLGLEELWFWVWKRLKGRRESAVVRRRGAAVMKMVWRCGGCGEEQDGSILRFAFLRLFCHFCVWVVVFPNLVCVL